MARKQNPINDIIDTAGAWLGGNRGTINPQVQRTIAQTKEVGKVIDQFAAGGMGQALVSDAQRMAASGSSTPSALYKTAAVNLAAAAAGVGAAKVAGKVAGKLPTSTKTRIGETISKVAGKDIVGVHVSPVADLSDIVAPSAAKRGTGMGPTQKYPLVPDVTYKVSTVANKLRTVSPNVVSNKAIGLGDTYYSQKGFSAYVTKSPLGKADPEVAKSGVSRITGRQKVVSEVKFPSFSSVPEDFDLWGRVPKTKEGKELVGKIRQAQQQIYGDVFQGSVNRVTGTKSGAGVGFAANTLNNGKKKSRGGGKNKK